jgi:limonene 1,2-monooxygenase
MMGIDPSTQRPRMDEALGVILRLFREADPFTHEADWFVLRQARLQLRPYTRPHMPVAVAAVQSPAGMVAAGKHGAGVLTFALPRGSNAETALRDFWGIAEDSAQQNGHTMQRSEWRIVVHVHLAESREQALAEARERAGRYQRDYFERTLGHPAVLDGVSDGIIDAMVERRLWCVGTPDDLIAFIEMLQERSGGFGGFMVQATEWATREQVFHSYELIARYVMPRFQGSLVTLEASNAAARAAVESTRTLQEQAIAQARSSYEAGRSGLT